MSVKDEEMAKFMKLHPNRFPNSVTRPWRGCGHAERVAARKTSGTKTHGQEMFGLLGGVLVAKAFGFTHNIPDELLE